MRRFDVVVVGAGPAGLSAAAELSRDRSCLLLDRGVLASARDRSSPDDLLSGIGGAGLFSDGKHSLFPSARALWQLPDRDASTGAIDATLALLREHGVADVGRAPAPAPIGDGVWQPKHYPSLYVPFAERLACIDRLWSACPDRFPSARVSDADAGGEIELHVERLGRCEEVQTRHLIVAAGRWSPPWMRTWLEKLGATYAFRRDEIGVRIETPVDHPLFAKLPAGDGKLIRREGELEIRTFSTCRDGEVVLGHADTVCAYSGRADCPPTGRSNVGLVVRGSFPGAVERAAHAEPRTFELRAWNRPDFLVDLFGDAGARALWRARECLLEWAPELANATVYAPAIEGVGDYPVDDGSLQIAPNVWIAGDACGRFRGIVAGMVSGRYVARRIMSTAR